MPDLCLLEVFKNLDALTTAKFMLMCRRWQVLASRQVVWKKCYQLDLVDFEEVQNYFFLIQADVTAFCKNSVKS